MQQFPHGNTAYTMTNLSLCPRSTNSDKHHEDPNKQLYSANQYDKYLTNIFLQEDVCRISPFPGNPQGNIIEEEEVNAKFRVEILRESVNLSLHPAVIISIKILRRWEDTC